MATIRNHVTRDIVSVDADSPSRVAARLMADRRIGSVAVTEGGTIIGLATERDLVATVLARGNDGQMPIREAMRPGMPRVSPDESEGRAADLMKEHFTRHLLVEEKGQVVGVVSMRDIIQLMLDEKQFVIQQLSDYVTGR
jgi:CBS domain-containing protein